MSEIFTFEKLYKAYLDCRRTKRKTINSLKFEWNLESNLCRLLIELQQKSYRPGRSICFAVSKPTTREIFAASFPDRVVHHLLIRELLAIGERQFIFDSFACRKEKGTHKAVKRLRSFMRKATGNTSAQALFLQLDIAGFFMNIDHNTLYKNLEKTIIKQKKSKSWKQDVLWLSRVIIFPKPTANYVAKGNMSLLKSIPHRKSLFHSGAQKGLPIGNYTSQFFANLYLNELDHFIKRKLKCSYYIRYVDDLILIAEDKMELKRWESKIQGFLSEYLSMDLNLSKTQTGSVFSGVDFLGYIVKPSCILVRRRVVGRLKEKLFYTNKKRCPDDRKALSTVNSYYGHFIHANSFNLRRNIYQNHLGKLRFNLIQKNNFSSVREKIKR